MAVILDLEAKMSQERKDKHTFKFFNENLVKKTSVIKITRLVLIL